MNINKQMLVSDYDQTFYLNDNDIEINKKIIEEFRNKGNIFVIATGRSYYDFKNKKNLYDINYDYLIINHGATILDNDDNIIFNCCIDNEIISDLKIDLETKEALKTFCCSAFESRVSFEHGDLTKIYVKYNDRNTAMKICDEINKKYDKYINAYFVTGNAVEIISSNIDKSSAIDLLLRDLGIEKSNVSTIGDGYSDIEMIKDFNGYCMKNSVDDVKPFAKKEFNSVSELVKLLMYK